MGGPVNAAVLDQLAPLRGDLQIRSAGTDRDGTPTWVIQDPVTNQFFRLGWLEFELLTRWAAGRAQQVLESVRHETLLDPSLEELEALHRFLADHQLLDIHDPQHAQQLVRLYERTRQSRWRWWLHHYLFFRLPLVRPSGTLQRWAQHLSWLYQPQTGWLIAALSVLGLVLAARQWDSFVASFSQSLTPMGFLGYVLALAVAKSVHELGHALTATRYGVRVAHMGVAFLVMWPMLYTDTTESWRLSNRQQRLAIASAGLLGELALAGLATLAWSLVDDGPVKQALFFLATTAWLISLTLNISPFMRFDGYFVLSDALDLPNLHERSFALARAGLRRKLLGMPEPDPEVFPHRLRRFLILFAWATWIYRVIVFTGIAVAVYLFFFKLLGMFLFAVEIWWFIARPVWREIRHWQQRRAEVSPSRGLLLMGVLLGLFLIAALPWRGTVLADGWVFPEQSQTLYSPLPARVQQLPSTGQAYVRGQTLWVLDQPDISHRAIQAAVMRSTLDEQQRRLVGQTDGLDKLPQLLQNLELKTRQWRAELAESERLTLTAPFDGVLLEADDWVQAGTWVHPLQALGVLVNPDRWKAEAFVGQSALSRIKLNGTAQVYPANRPGTVWTATVVAIERTQLPELPHPMLSTVHGGSVSTHALPGAALAPRDSLYRVVLALDPTVAQRPVLATIGLPAEPRSWLLEQLKPIAIVLIRELSF
jgi:putative peptide zinc metalloprotease protein